METFSKRLISALEIRHMTAAELSRKIGVNEGTISNYKKGIYEPKQRRLDEISRILNVSIPWLMGADVEFSSRVDDALNSDFLVKVKSSITSEELNIIKMYRNLDDRGKKAVIDTIERETKYIKKARLLNEQTDDEMCAIPVAARSGEKANIVMSESEFDETLKKLKPSKNTGL